MQHLRKLEQRAQLGGGEGAHLLAEEAEQQVEGGAHMPHFEQQPLRRIVDAVAHGGVAAAQIDVFKGRAVHPAAAAGGRGGLGEHPLAAVELLFGEAVVEGAFDVEHVGRGAVFPIDEAAS